LQPRLMWKKWTQPRVGFIAINTLEMLDFRCQAFAQHR
jgi:hypothetical protein